MDTLNSLDLSQAPDHPAKIVNQWVEDKIKPMYPEVAISTARQAGVTLREFEEDNNVTFAALSNVALADLREAFARSLTTDLDAAHLAMLDLRSAVNDLLGLDNQ